MGLKQKEHLKRLNSNQDRENNRNWKGGRIINSCGYVLLLDKKHPRAKGNNGYVMEHILIMEKEIRRFLDADEVVHHKNENRQDNRIENLKLMTISEHLSLHSKDSTYVNGKRVEGGDLYEAN